MRLLTMEGGHRGRAKLLERVRRIEWRSEDFVPWGPAVWADGRTGWAALLLDPDDVSSWIGMVMSFMAANPGGGRFMLLLRAGDSEVIVDLPASYLPTFVEDAPGNYCRLPAPAPVS